jgi:hypothetical protein
VVVRVWILIGGAAFFGVFTMCLAKAAVDGGGFFPGGFAVVTGAAAFMFTFIAAGEAD